MALQLLLVAIQHTFAGRPQPGDDFPLHVCYPYVLRQRHSGTRTPRLLAEGRVTILNEEVVWLSSI